MTDLERLDDIAKRGMIQGCDLDWLVQYARDLLAIVSDLREERGGGKLYVVRRYFSQHWQYRYFSTLADARAYAAKEADACFKCDGYTHYIDELQGGADPVTIERHPLDVCQACNGRGLTTEYYGHRDYEDRECTACDCTGRVKL